MQKQFDPDKKISIKELETSHKNYEDYLRKQTSYSEKQIQENLILHRKMVGLPVETGEEKRNRITLEEVRKWIAGISGRFNIKDLYAWIPELARRPTERRQISTCLGRLVKEGLLEREGRYGVYRKIESELEKMDFVDANEKGIDIWLPFNLRDYAEIMAGGIIIIAGEQDTGKTTLALNIAWANRNMWDVHYFNSELGAGALKRKTLLFKNTEPFQWQEKINFYILSHDFQDFIRPGPDKLNIIDFMEATGDEYPYVAGWIKKIHDKIIDNGAIAIICLQKPPGRDEAVGGRGTLDKARLYLSVSRGTIKIVRAKDWASSMNPRDLALQFKIINGSDLIPTTEWEKTDKWTL